MLVLAFLAYACFALAALLGILAIGEGEPIFLAAAISLVVSGVLFLALNKVIETLLQIRDAIKASGGGERISSGNDAIASRQEDNKADHKIGVKAPQKSIAELSEDLERLKKNLKN